MKFISKLGLFRNKYLRIATIGGLVCIVAAFILLLVANFLIAANGKYILNSNDQPAIDNKHIRVGLVLGAGITKQGKPFRELQARLDVAATALQHGEVDKLLLSGDNRFPKYDEPGAMKKYLMEQKHIPASRLQPDYAGRSTYESCERANKVFGQTKILIISAHSHLPRAIYLCRHFDIEAYGIASTAEANNSQRREIIARAKAVFNIYIKGENTVLGPSIKL